LVQRKISNLPNSSWSHTRVSLSFHKIMEKEGKTPYVWDTAERTVEDQLASLSEAQLEAFQTLKNKWLNKAERPIEFNDYMLLRFIRNSPGKEKFNDKTAFKVLENYEKWAIEWGGLQNLKISDVRKQLEKHQMILLPDSCRTRHGHQIIYVRISRHVPAQDSIEDLIKSLAYLMERVTEREKSCTEGIAFLQDFSDVGWKHFSLRDLAAIGAALQGKFPIRIRMVMAVNTPRIFKTCLALAKPLMTTDLQSKIHVFTSVDEVADLIEGGSDSLPIELGGRLDADEVAEEYIKRRNEVETSDPNYTL
jgi:hypothetical protein